MNESITVDHPSSLTARRNAARGPVRLPLVAHTGVQFDELHKLVDQLSHEEYTVPVPILSGSTIGQHVRHVLEFYICLMDATGGTVNYDARKRDRTLETDRSAVLLKLHSLRKWMDHIDQDVAMELLVDHSHDGRGATSMSTSLFRELAYAFDHGIHHMALLRIAVEQHHTMIALDPDFGVAPSTIRDRKAIGR